MQDYREYKRKNMQNTGTSGKARTRKKAKKAKLSSYVLTYLFIMLTFGTPIVSYVTGVDKDAKNTENRTKATFDAVKAAKYVDVAEKFDEYYNDNLPLRSTIINTWSGLKFSIFGEIKSNNVISGKADGSKAKTWLFYEADSDHNPVRTATGIDQYPDTIKQALDIGIETNTKNAKLNNVKLYYMFAPNKENIYKDKLPSSILIKDRESGLDKYIKSSKYENLLYAKDVLEGHLAENIYFRQDTHWNDYGAYLAFAQLMSKIEPSYDTSAYSMEVKEKNADNRDLAQMCGIVGGFKDDIPIVHYRDQDSFSIMNDADKKYLVSENPDAPINQTLLIIGDSYREYMIDYFRKTYTRVIDIHRGNYKPSYFADIKANVVIIESVERYASETSEIRVFENN